ncbi:hypothetical protein C8R46DRAFT_1320283 [Mycena filopes]|nr:hypothetical protein C8R46DRAFT_1320283 [Mycena filopes]
MVLHLIPHAPGEPILPPDIERLIFEVAASSNLRSVPNLMLVAWRVRDWVEPLLYRVLFLASDLSGHSGAPILGGFPVLSVERFLCRIATPSRPGFNVPQAVRHMFIHAAEEVHPDLLATILTACTRTTNLFAHLGSHPEEKTCNTLTEMVGLQRLTTTIKPLVDINHGKFLNYPKFDFTPPHIPHPHAP